MMKHNKIILYWEEGKFSKQITMDKDSNCRFIRTVSSYQKYNKFAIAMNSQVEQPNDKWRDIEKPKSYIEKQTNEDIEPITPFNFDESIHKMEELQHLQKDDKLQRELWRWNLKLNHLSSPKIKFMALLGRLPKRLNSTDVPFCPTCPYSKATRIPWRNKNGNIKLKETNEPRQCVSVVTFKSSTAGFVAQLKGSLTNKRYRVATVFIDHFNDLSFVFPQEDNTSAELIRVKVAFEKFANSCGVNMLHYMRIMEGLLTMLS